MFDFLDNKEVITLIASIVGVIWSFIKTTKFFKDISDNRYVEAIRLLEAAIEYTYDIYVREIKSRGKLTDKERITARNIAINKLIDLGKEKGLDTIKILGPEMLNSLISKIIAERKNG